MSTAWITGAHGFIGRHLVRHLSRSGCDVYGIGHGHWPEAERQLWGVKYWLNGDVEHSNLQRLFEEGGTPDVVFHLAGGSSVGLSMQQPLEDFRRSVDSTAQLLDWMSRRIPNVRLVYVSSAAVYGAGHEQCICEETALTPFSPYGHHKAMAEQLCRCFVESYGMSVSIVRFFSIYGPGLRKQLIWDVCSRLMHNTHVCLGGSGEEQRDWLYIDDAVRLLAYVWQTSESPLFIVNGGTGRAISVAGVMEVLQRVWSQDMSFEFTGESRPGDPQYLVADPVRMHTLGFYPEVSFEDGIKATVAWFEAHQNDR